MKNTNPVLVFFILLIGFLLPTQEATAQLSITIGASNYRFVGNDAFGTTGLNGQVIYRPGNMRIAFLVRGAQYQHEIERTGGGIDEEGDFQLIEAVAGVRIFLNEKEFKAFDTSIFIEPNVGLNHYTVTTSRIIYDNVLPPETRKRSLFHIGTRVGGRLGWQHVGLEFFLGSFLPFNPDGGSVLAVEGGVGLYLSL